MAVANQTGPAGLLNLERELVCFICTEVLYQPLTLIDCLHTFCASCLKEWFSHQHRKASHSRSSSSGNPYTCPTCRSPVKDARHNATVTTLLDMFLAANPEKARSEDDLKEMTNYKPGEDILPKIEAPRHRSRRARREEEDIEAMERRMIEEARTRSLRDTPGQPEDVGGLVAPAETREESRSRERDERRERRRDQDRTERRRRVEAAEAAHARDRATSQNGSTSGTAALSPPSTSPRHPNAVEARERGVSHQASLISLVSASESTGTGDSFSEARIMQEILSAGLLEGINVDELTEAEQDELSERIAEAYRQRHQARSVSSVQATTGEETVPDRPRTNREDSERNHGHRSRSDQPTQRTQPTEQTSAPSGDSSNPATTRSRHLAVVDSRPASDTTAHRRRASDQSRRHTSPVRQDQRATSGGPQNLAIRSATDLSDRPRRPEASQSDLGHHSPSRRTNTDPIQTERASEARQQEGIEAIPEQRASQTRVDPPSHPAVESKSTSRITIGHAIANSNRSSTPPPVPPRLPLPTPFDTGSFTTNPQPRSTSPVPLAKEFEEPSITCSRCSKLDIQYELHKHCSRCVMDLCLRCYRDGRGCDHWFGFGHAAMSRFEASQPVGRSSGFLEPPHVLAGRKYQQPANNKIKRSRSDTLTKVPIATTTTCNPTKRLQEGNFCDSCQRFANACFWSCDYCNEGDWGFCNDCVNANACCTHPLLPIAHKSFAPHSPSQQRAELEYDPHHGATTLTPSELHATVVRNPDRSRPSTADGSPRPGSDRSEYVPLTFTTTCDICATPIPPLNSRYHCPSHPSPPTSQPTSVGDYDVCTTCYQGLAKTGRIKRDDGPHGWRRCPDGHRMIVIGFEVDSDGNQRRVIHNDLVGGLKITDEDMALWRSGPSSTAAVDPAGLPLPSAGNGGRWSWRDDSAPSRRNTRTRAPTLVSSASSRFPPDGGYGKTCVAMWSYYPDDGEEAKGELMFPKSAEVCEVEEINDEWSFGVYIGQKGLFPAAYVREYHN